MQIKLKGFLRNLNEISKPQQINVRVWVSVFKIKVYQNVMFHFEASGFVEKFTMDSKNFRTFFYKMVHVFCFAPRPHFSENKSLMTPRRLC